MASGSLILLLLMSYRGSQRWQWVH